MNNIVCQSFFYSPDYSCSNSTLVEDYHVLSGVEEQTIDWFLTCLSVGFFFFYDHTFALFGWRTKRLDWFFLFLKMNSDKKLNDLHISIDPMMIHYVRMIIIRITFIWRHFFFIRQVLFICLMTNNLNMTSGELFHPGKIN